MTARLQGHRRHGNDHNRLLVLETLERSEGARHGASGTVSQKCFNSPDEALDLAHATLEKTRAACRA